jgi:hypothetical protein
MLMRNYFIDKTGEIALEVNGFQKVGSFSEGLVVVRTERTFCGFIDKSGSVVIEPKFFEASPFSEGLSVVKTKEKGFLFQPQTKWGFIDKTGQIIYEENFDLLSSFSEGVAIAAKDDAIVLIDKTGKIILTLNTDEIHIDVWDWANARFSDGLILAFDPETEKRGFMDKTGKFAIEPKFENASSFSEGLARVSVIEKHREYLGFINRNGEYVIPPKFDIDSDFLRCTTDFSEGLASLIDEPPTVERDPCFMYIDKTGETVLKTNFFYANPFHEGLASVWDAETEKNGYIDKSGKLVIPLHFDLAGNFSEGLALVSKY